MDNLQKVNNLINISSQICKSTYSCLTLLRFRSSVNMRCDYWIWDDRTGPKFVWKDRRSPTRHESRSSGRDLNAGHSECGDLPIRSKRSMCFRIYSLHMNHTQSKYSEHMTSMQTFVICKTRIHRAPTLPITNTECKWNTAITHFRKFCLLLFSYIIPVIQFCNTVVTASRIFGSKRNTHTPLKSKSVHTVRNRNRDSSVGITGLRAGWSSNLGLISGGKRTSQHTFRLCNPPSLLLNGYLGLKLEWVVL
jgi:hypothetical protein